MSAEASWLLGTAVCAFIGFLVTVALILWDVRRYR